MGKCIAVTSGKGGTGKSTISSGLAISFAKCGKKVLLVDLDIGLRCLDIFFGIEDSIVFDISDVLNSGNFANALYKANCFDNIYIAPAPASDKELNPERFADFLSFCEPKFDIILIDMPAGINFRVLSKSTDILKFITVCNPDPISVRDASVVCDKLSEFDKKASLIINKFDAELIKNGTYKNFDDIVDISNTQLLGVVPQSLELMLLPVRHKISKHGRAYKALKRINGRICGENILLPRPKKI